MGLCRFKKTTVIWSAALSLSWTALSQSENTNPIFFYQCSPINPSTGGNVAFNLSDGASTIQGVIKHKDGRVTEVGGVLMSGTSKIRSQYAQNQPPFMYGNFNWGGMVGGGFFASPSDNHSESRLYGQMVAIESQYSQQEAREEYKSQRTSPSPTANPNPSPSSASPSFPIPPPRPGDLAADTERPGDVAARVELPGQLAAETRRPGDLAAEEMKPGDAVSLYNGGRVGDKPVFYIVKPGNMVVLSPGDKAYFERVYQPVMPRNGDTVPLRPGEKIGKKHTSAFSAFIDSKGNITQLMYRKGNESAKYIKIDSAHPTSDDPVFAKLNIQLKQMKAFAYCCNKGQTAKCDAPTDVSPKISQQTKKTQDTQKPGYKGFDGANPFWQMPSWNNGGNNGGNNGENKGAK